MFAFSTRKQVFPTGRKAQNLDDQILSDQSKGKKYSRELQDSLDYSNCQYVKDFDGPYGNLNDGYLAKYMGRGFVFRLKEHTSGNQEKDQRDHRIDQMMAVKKVMVGIQMHKSPKIRYPFATHRVVGRTWPGEARRQQRQAYERKQTRSEVDQLCKYMLWKNNKFMPGKMV